MVNGSRLQAGKICKQIFYSLVTIPAFTPVLCFSGGNINSFDIGSTSSQALAIICFVVDF